MENDSVGWQLDRVIIRVVTDGLDRLVTACLQPGGPTPKDILEARKLLPARCENTLLPRTPNVLPE